VSSSPKNSSPAKDATGTAGFPVSRAAPMAKGHNAKPYFFLGNFMKARPYQPRTRLKNKFLSFSWLWLDLRKIVENHKK
jgi:hypothetical protein